MAGVVAGKRGMLSSAAACSSSVSSKRAASREASWPERPSSRASAPSTLRRYSRSQRSAAGSEAQAIMYESSRMRRSLNSISNLASPARETVKNTRVLSKKILLP
jgi:hypothetical protein